MSTFRSIRIFRYSSAFWFPSGGFCGQGLGFPDADGGRGHAPHGAGVREPPTGLQEYAESRIRRRSELQDQRPTVPIYTSQVFCKRILFSEDEGGYSNIFSTIHWSTWAGICMHPLLFGLLGATETSARHCLSFVKTFGPFKDHTKH